ncbi:unnamed protein product [Spodoptera littoralis]|uniref:Peroxisome assembly protein 12 n=1 Tax=Spodoptera littoralis TaxID=7109 RepID=A0A9P0I6Y8_SPOLI|nr:unnamed protein product [Spodoptera littoralis]CAH1640899.1 unnamed protein product [Spodoptera littoralis]
MAVYAAHLTRTLQGTPSVFQVTAQEALGSTVKPALRKVVEFLSVTYPTKCGWCLRYYDELYLLFDTCLQYYYLKHYAASFSESFYDLLRVPTVTNEFTTGQQLPVHLERASLALLVLVPYIQDRLEALVERWREDDEDGRLGKSAPDRVRRAAVVVWRAVRVASWAARAVWLARYVAGRGAAHSLSLAVLGLGLRPAPPRPPYQYTWGDLIRNLFTGQFSGAEWFPLVGGGALRVVEYGAFAVQFLRWWDTRAAPTTSLPTPPPPQRDERAVRWKNKCPICLQSWKIPTVLPVSGYVYCYACIARELRARPQCPVTALPATEASLVRLYVD